MFYTMSVEGTTVTLHETKGGSDKKTGRKIEFLTHEEDHAELLRQTIRTLVHDVLLIEGKQCSQCNSTGIVEEKCGKVIFRVACPKCSGSK